MGAAVASRFLACQAEAMLGSDRSGEATGNLSKLGNCSLIFKARPGSAGRGAARLGAARRGTARHRQTRLTGRKRSHFSHNKNQ